MEAMWCVTLHAVLQNKSVVCSGSRDTNSTVMKLHGSYNRGGIAVKTCTKSNCSHQDHVFFRKGGFLGRYEQWSIDGNQLEEVNKYVY